MHRSATVLLALAAATACGDPIPDTRSIPLSLDTIEFRDPDVDFEQAVEHDEIHFVAIMDIGWGVPGFSNDCPNDLVAEFGSTMVDGTSDGATGARGRLDDMARTYAEQFNRLILDHLYEHGDERIRRLAMSCRRRGNP